MGVVYVNVCVSNHLKEELAWAVDKQLQKLKKKVILNLKQYYIPYYVTLSNVF